MLCLRASVEEEPLMVIEVTSCLKFFFSNFKVLQRYFKMVATLFLNGVALLTMSQEIIQSPPITAPLGTVRILSSSCFNVQTVLSSF
jgi:hypothetical protein